MLKSIISEGKTSTEAIEKGLKELNVTRNMVDIKIIEEHKKSFFSILDPRVVKVELTLKETKNPHHEVQNITEKSEKLPKSKAKPEEIQIAKKQLEQFLEEFCQKIDETIIYQIREEESYLCVDIEGKETGLLIGYRGENLNALQNIFTAIASKGIESKINVLLDIEHYRDKRRKTLENLAERMAKNVIRNKKSVTLEPMCAYERKIIHSKLQSFKNIKTYSIGEEPYRKIVISLYN